MAGLDPAIHVFLTNRGKDVDARHKAGQDGDTPYAPDPLLALEAMIAITSFSAAAAVL